MEIKAPTPQIPPPVWTEFKDLQEWEKYHQERDDRGEGQGEDDLLLDPLPREGNLPIQIVAAHVSPVV